MRGINIFLLCLCANTSYAELLETQEDVVRQPVDKITLKQSEMRDTIVLVKTRRGTGSGTIFDRLEDDNIFEYHVLTNAHVTNGRFITTIIGVDVITGVIKKKTIDTGCKIVVFNNYDRSYDVYNTRIIAENQQLDLVILSFKSKKKLVTARIANDGMLSRVRVFDEIFVVSCQFGKTPMPTTGIISNIIKGRIANNNWTIYGMTAQIAPGSSGGGLFKQYGGHYYLIGIPYRQHEMMNGQIIPHLGQAISLTTTASLIDENSVSE